MRTKRSGAAAYLRSRRLTVLFAALFIAGLAIGSVYALSGESSREVVREIILRSLQKAEVMSFWNLFRTKLVVTVCLVIYLYIAANCRIGTVLASAMPVIFGISIGSLVSVLLEQYGSSALGYAAVAVALPKTLQLAVLILACNAAVRQSKSMQASADKNSFGVWGIILLLFLLARLLECILQRAASL